MRRGGGVPALGPGPFLKPYKPLLTGACRRERCRVPREAA